MKNNHNLNIDKVLPIQESDIKLESPNIEGDLGFGGYHITELYADFILVEYIDVSDDLIEENGILKPSETKNWRKGVVRLISRYVKEFGVTEVGDIVTFPNDRGLTSGGVSYRDENGVITPIEQGVFLNEGRIFTKLLPNIPYDSKDSSV